MNCLCGRPPLLRETRDGLWLICCEDASCTEQVIICRRQRADAIAQWDAEMQTRPTLPDGVNPTWAADS